MGNVVEVHNQSGTTVGSITFEESPDNLAATRTAGGFKLDLPVTVRLTLANSRDPWPMLSNISATIAAFNEERQSLTVGRARYYGWFTGAIPQSAAPTALLWSDSLSALARYETFRNGGRPRFRITVLAELCYLVPQLTGWRVRTEPQQVHGDVEIAYPTDIWMRMVRGLGLSLSVLLEVPLPSTPAKPWDAIWQAVAEAITAFERGGETGWKGCGTAVRLALDEWRSIEREDMGPGWKQPSREDLEARTARQRLDNIRYHLRQYVHLAPHTGAEQWSRDDALLMLSAISSLLLVRNP